MDLDLDWAGLAVDLGSVTKDRGLPAPWSSFLKIGFCWNSERRLMSSASAAALPMTIRTVLYVVRW